MSSAETRKECYSGILTRNNESRNHAPITNNDFYYIFVEIGIETCLFLEMTCMKKLATPTKKGKHNIIIL